ncbi:hypothetical protein [Sphingomonas sp. Leaf34]|uniref:hypothetical protein n=1 Tax=Sphingomonas sp. Leaf34 TaxID=1736216 RepID=UPI0012E2D1D3|nr:hypothetical protein [Sphingomonas sp. Leaf34]
MTTMTNDAPHSVTMTTARSDGRVVITVTGQSTVPKTVHYHLTVTGASATHHRGRTRVHGDRRVLSQVSVMATTAGCAILTVVEGDHDRYEDRLCF